MRAKLLIVCILLSALCHAQDTSVLGNYLRQHRYSIDLKADKPFYMLPQMMPGKNLLVLGEGGSHKLHLYRRIKPAILNQLATQHLKDYFIEFGHSTAWLIDGYVHRRMPTCLTAFPNYCNGLDAVQNTLGKDNNFRVVGIDFEAMSDLNTALKQLLINTGKDKIAATMRIVGYAVDDSSFYHIKYFKEFMQLYRANRKAFYADSAAIHRELDDKYPTFKYMLTNSNTTRPSTNRNGAMARNLLSEITPIDTAATYFLSIGMAHSIPNNKMTTVHKIAQDPQLHGRVMVMNTYCQDCIAEGIPTTPYSLATFLNKANILACFSNAATTDLTLFDLSRLPPDLAYMKDYGELLLFAKHSD